MRTASATSYSERKWAARAADADQRESVVKCRRAAAAGDSGPVQAEDANMGDCRREDCGKSPLKWMGPACAAERKGL